MVYLQPKQSLGYQQHSFRLLLCICTTGIIQTSQAFYIYMGTTAMYNYTWRIPLAFISPCRFPFVSPLLPSLLTWNPPSCDRIRRPRSQVACKLTSPVPTLYPNPPPSKFQEPQLPSALLRRPQEQSGVFCPEQYLSLSLWDLSAGVVVAAADNNSSIFGIGPQLCDLVISTTFG
jgi:hypothetical protein